MILLIKKKLSNNLLDTGYFGAIQYTEDNMDMFNDIIAGMNNIVYLIIAFSSFLAITVLYNLTIININERKREIATLKVLGFRDREVSSYVYRETIILTIVGIIVGIFLGFSLNTFILMIAETDEILFIKIIKPLSYVLSFIIIVVFSVIVQVITYFILKRVYDRFIEICRIEKFTYTYNYNNLRYLMHIEDFTSIEKKNFRSFNLTEVILYHTSVIDQTKHLTFGINSITYILLFV